MHETTLYASSDGVAGTDSSGRYMPLTHVQQKLHVVPYYWNPSTLAYEVAQQASGGSGGSTGGLTDTQLRASPVPVSGPVTDAQLRASSLPVATGLAQPLTDTQLRASALPISAAALPLPAGAAQDGTDISAPTAMPAGGVGIRGWLSAIWTKLNGSLVVSQATPANLQATVTQGAAGAAAWLADVSDRAGRALGIVSNANIDVALSTRLKPADTLAAVTNLAQLAGVAPTMKAASTPAAAADPALVVALSPNSAMPQPDTLLASVLQTTANTAQAAMVSLAAAGAGLFHYIDSITITRVNNTATAVAADTTVRQITSANFNGFAHELGSVLAAGAAETFLYQFPSGMRSQVANTLTSFSVPAGGAGTKIRITVAYRIGV